VAGPFYLFGITDLQRFTRIEALDVHDVRLEIREGLFIGIVPGIEVIISGGTGDAAVLGGEITDGSDDRDPLGRFKGDGIHDKLFAFFAQLFAGIGHIIHSRFFYSEYSIYQRRASNWGGNKTGGFSAPGTFLQVPMTKKQITNERKISIFKYQMFGVCFLYLVFS
jgi:hypothetical protein